MGHPYAFFSAERLCILQWMITARRCFIRVIAQLLGRDAARTKPANVFDFLGIDLRKHRNYYPL